MTFFRPQYSTLSSRLLELPTQMIVIAGPRQIGKSFMVRQALEGRQKSFVAVDNPDLDQDFLSPQMRADTSEAKVAYIPGALPTAEWLVQKWNDARVQAMKMRLQNGSASPYVLAIDEIQKIPRWSEIVKGLWDADRAVNLNMHVVLLGSSPWLMQQGLTESLAGRYELLNMSHWSYQEMREAFNFSLDEYIYFGGYPGSAQLIREEARWRDYVRGALIQPNIEKDILQMTRVDKPALLKSMFELGCTYSGQIISYTKLVGQLQDAGNTVTLADYLHLLSRAGLLTGLFKYSEVAHRQRSSSPKLNVLNTALMSAIAGYTFEEALADRTYWGRLVESVVGAHLCNTAEDNCKVQYWREGNNEVDFVLNDGKNICAIEVKSGAGYAHPKGLDVFAQKFPKTRKLIVGDHDVSLSEVLSAPANSWL